MEAATTPGLAHPPARAGRHRSRWAAIGAAVAVAFGGGGLLGASASDSAPGNYVAITPCRVVDTRPAPDNVGPRATPIGPAETYSTAFVGAVGTCNIPTNAVAVVLNLAVVNPTAGSYLTVFPAGGSVPLASNLNFVAGQPPVANSATVQIGTDGELSFFNLTGTVDVIADVSGYYLPAGARNQDITFGSRAVDWYSSESAPSTINNCTTLSSGVSFGVIPLDLPIGAAIHSISAVVFDGAASTPYSIGLFRQRTGPTGIDIGGGTPLLEITGGTSSIAAITSVATSSSTFPVTATDSYWLEVSLGTASANAFCSATVTVTMP
jgi:hypothetical protein